jgi:hypothetical protein
VLRHDDHRPTPVSVEEHGAGPVLTDRDAQLALWMIYELSYRGFDGVPAAREWDVPLIELRLDLESRFEEELREVTGQSLLSLDDREAVGAELLALVEAYPAPRLSAYLRRDATEEQMIDYLRERSVQQLKESDPQSFILPRLEGAAKVALAEIQYDEYGAGRPEDLHQTLYATTLRAVGLDPTYGAYIDAVSAISLAGANVMSLFALNRRLRGAAVGHFAAFEASSSVPSRRVAAGLERLSLPDEAAAYFHEHVEADSVHEQVAAHDLCGSVVSEYPELRDDVLFGAASALALDALSAEELLARWADSAAADEPRRVAS